MFFTTRRLTRALLFSSLVSLPAFSAHAQSQSCNGAERNLETKIASCTSALKEFAGQTLNLAITFNHRAEAYLKKGDKVRALADFDQAIKLNPGHTVARNQRAALYNELGKYREAIVDYTYIIDSGSLAVKNAFFYNGRAEAYCKSGEYAKGFQDVETALKRHAASLLSDPSDIGSYYDTRANCHELKGDKVKAIADYKKALQYDPQLKESKDGLARLSK